ncbi:remodeling and spacing factor 1 [Leptidea sinapis]|uniref:remodeling and spacing factor 1 n=1 Tax=Leptidea sinapis TaxID=189913 RepID=UPI0021269F18|nr:remodeling and spacing factor 1 [Leptidea sinapis]
MSTMASDGETSCTNDPNFAAIYSFLKVFGKLYGLEIPTISILQEWIENSQEVLEPLRELHLRLLRRALKSAQSNRWEKCLIKFCHQQTFHQEAWEIERFSYKKASTQVKLKVLKLLLEYQFTCHPKFKNAVNNLSSKDLRLNPIGRDKNSCLYWLQVDHEANLCLFKEDQDEETWHLVARNRDELVKVIAQLKAGEATTPVVTSTNNILNSDDSSGNEVQKIGKPAKTSEDEEEFLSPESETDHESDGSNEKQNRPSEVQVETEKEEKKENVNNVDNKVTDVNTSDSENSIEKQTTEVVKAEDLMVANEKGLDQNKDNRKKKSSCHNSEDSEDGQSVSEAIEEPVMMVTGEGNGADCESYYFGEEICEPVMYIFGEGSGYDNCTGNPEGAEKSHSDDKSEDEDPTDEWNGDSSEVSISNKLKLRRSAKSVSVAKRSLKKQSDTTELLKIESKKQCKRDINKSKDSDTVNNKDEADSDTVENCAKDNVNKSRKKKIKSKVKKKKLLRSFKKKDDNNLNCTTENDKCQNGKTSIIEKRKSSLSSDQDEERTTNKKNISYVESKVEEPLPSKKLRLETSQDLDDVSHSKETVDPLDCKNDVSNDNIENKDLNTDKNYDSISNRKKIRAKKGKFKSRKFSRVNESKGKASDIKKSGKSLKRSLLNVTLIDKNKSESHSESEEDEPAKSGKRLKIKPKVIMKSTRKKVEAKLMTKCSSESEEETLLTLASKKTLKKLKKKTKSDKNKSDKNKSEKLVDEDGSRVRQSRRIAQMKIKEEADRRHLEEVALRELKMIHKKKNKDEEEWRASGTSSESDRKSRAKKHNKWRSCDSTGPEQDSESEEPLFEHDEPEIDYNKSDHEFSPESDLESGECEEPVKKARTMIEAGREGVCKRCGSGEQPEWILVCERCEAGYHASCLTPVLLMVPPAAWYCPPCDHESLISALESELGKYDELVIKLEEERVRKAQEQIEQTEKAKETEEENTEKREEKQSNGDSSEDNSEDSSEWSSSSSDGAVYRLRARRQLPVSYRDTEYDRLMSSAIKEEYVEPTTSAGNQGRGKDISTIIEAAEEEKMKAEREAIEQGKVVEVRKTKRVARRKPRKLNSLEIPSEDDETDEDFRDIGAESSSEEISSASTSGSVPLARSQREHRERKSLAESSPEGRKKKKGVFAETSSDSPDTKEWSNKSKKKSRSSHRRGKSRKSRKSGLSQYDAAGNVVRARVTYGGLSDEPNDWSPKHRTRHRTINYTEMPNTESEDEMHKSSGKHMADSSDEFKISSDDSSGSAPPERPGGDQRRTISDLIKKTAVVPLEKLPEDVTRAKTEALQAALERQAAQNARTPRGRGIRGRGSRGGGRGRGGRNSGGPSGASAGPEDALAKLVGVKIKELRPDCAPLRPNQVERDRKRQEREAKQAEKEARRLERLQKKEEKEKMKEQKAKEREEKRLAKLAQQENKRVKKEFSYVQPQHQEIMGQGRPVERFQPQQPRLQVRPELRGMAAGADERVIAQRHQHHHLMREGTLSVAGSPQPFKPVSEEPSVITRMPHMLNQQYRGQMMYPPRPTYGAGSPYPPSPRPPPAPYPQYYFPRAPPAYRAPLPPRPLFQAAMSDPGSSPHLLVRGPSPTAARPAPPAGSPHQASPDEASVRIKAEVKTEPEYNSPPASPTRRPSSPEQPRNRIKRTENKDGRRHPLGPYAPQYGPYGPYAPPASQGQEIPINHPLQRMPMPYHAPNEFKRHSPSRENYERDRPIPPEGRPPNRLPEPIGPERLKPDMNRPPETSILHDMIRAPLRPILSDMLRHDRPVTSTDMRCPPNRHSQPFYRPTLDRNMHEMLRAPGPERHEMHRAPGPERHEMLRAPGPERHEMLRCPGPDRIEMLRAPAPESHEILRAPRPERLETIRATVPEGHEMLRGTGPERHEMLQAPRPPRLEMLRGAGPGNHEMLRGPTPYRNDMLRGPGPNNNEMLRTPGPERHEMLRSAGLENNEMLRASGPENNEIIRAPGTEPNESLRGARPEKHDTLGAARPERNEILPGAGPENHEILRAPERNEILRGARSDNHDLHRAPRPERHEMIRASGMERHEMIRVPAPERHDMGPVMPDMRVADLSHYPYMRPQIRYSMPVRHLQSERFVYDVNRMEKPMHAMRDSVLMKPPSPGAPGPVTVRPVESPKAPEPPPSPPDIKPQIQDDHVNNDVELKLSNLKMEEPADSRRGEEGGVFGGLVSYFSSQREDDLV